MLKHSCISLTIVSISGALGFAKGSKSAGGRGRGAGGGGEEQQKTLFGEIGVWGKVAVYKLQQAYNYVVEGSGDVVEGSEAVLINQSALEAGLAGEVEKEK